MTAEKTANELGAEFMAAREAAETARDALKDAMRAEGAARKAMNERIFEDLGIVQGETVFAGCPMRWQREGRFVLTISEGGTVYARFITKSGERHGGRSPQALPNEPFSLGSTWRRETAQ